MVKKKQDCIIFCIYTHSLFDFTLKLEGFVWEKHMYGLFCTSLCMGKKIQTVVKTFPYVFKG